MWGVNVGFYKKKELEEQRPLLIEGELCKEERKFDARKVADLVSFLERDGEFKEKHATLLGEFAIECPEKRDCIEQAFQIYAKNNKGTQKEQTAMMIIDTIRAVRMLELLSVYY